MLRWAPLPPWLVYRHEQRRLAIAKYFGLKYSWASKPFHECTAYGSNSLDVVVSRYIIVLGFVLHIAKKDQCLNHAGCQYQSFQWRLGRLTSSVVHVENTSELLSWSPKSVKLLQSGPFILKKDNRLASFFLKASCHALFTK